MSTLYNLEPQPTAKVVLQTTSGNVELELFANQIPLASRNFLQHCLDGYYNDTIFHRVVPGFIVQGGDPTGTGFGGESAFDDGTPFEDEFHSRLKYNRRGLLGMANSGKKNDNGSQFFFTLGETPELAGKNTLFGRVVGDTIFNVVKMGDVDMAEEGGDRPLYPTRITGAEIIINPFEDMVRRERTATSVGKVEKTKKPKRKAGKALLSFGDEEDGVEVPAVKKPKFNTKLVSGEGSSITPTMKTSAKVANPPPQPKPIRSRSPPPKPESNTAAVPSPVQTRRSSSSPSPTSSPPPVSRQAKALAKTEAEYAALKASLRRDGPRTNTIKEKPKSALEAMIPSTSTRGRKRGTVRAADEARTLAMFAAFKNKLDAVDADASEEEADPDSLDNANGKRYLKPEAAAAQDNDEEAAVCDLHFIVNCQSCGNWTANGDDEDDTGEGWLRHKLSFAKDRLGKDLEWKRKNEEELLVVDPREKAKELGVEKAGGPKERRTREWDKGREGRGGRVK